ncbi:uncharacterized protein B0T15DRAFT_187231 [Chaetomium strumarium]|uniref:Uncharacterized protein n=1 Tax=Chaetomium strumarium TaxID=1170767 RepID=A0AAJ0GSE1_9PEZI|nr:hypothetical protein B0T15DRAFT_187231 [Chaetomium strumarium]
MKSLVTRVLQALSPSPSQERPASDATSPACPTEIRRNLPTGNPSFSSMTEIHAAMLTCPDIATLQVRTVGSGCSEWPDRFNFPFDLRGGERYASAPLVLSLDGYDFDESEWRTLCGPLFDDWDLTYLSWMSWRRLWQCARLYYEVPEVQRLRTNLDLWVDAMDFSRIHTLQLNYTRGRSSLTEQVVQKLPSRLTSLTTLAVHHSMAQGFILSLPKGSLTHLSWQNPTRDYRSCGDSHGSPFITLEPVLQHQGWPLQSLEYHSEEWDTHAPPTLSVLELGQLTKLAPGLRTLTINLPRQLSASGGETWDWPWESLRLLAEGLPQLTDLTIYFELASECHRQSAKKNNSWVEYDGGDGSRPLEDEDGCVGLDHYAQPLLNKTNAVPLARFLAHHKSGQRLRSVMFRAGDWGPDYDGPLRFGAPWLEGRRAWVMCRWGDPAIAGSEDGAGSGDVVCEGGTGGLYSWEEDAEWMEYGGYGYELGWQ